jgi:cytochrome c
MVPLSTLSTQDVDLLVDVVLQMRREGVREQYVAQLPPDEEPVPEDVDEVVQIRTTPGDVAAIPDLGAADGPGLTLGKQLYVQQACPSCHGETGTGDQVMPLFDTAGRPDFPRDLVHDPFKGGNTPDSIYRRVLLGMPGTPHPANVNMTTQELIALTHYCHSLGQVPKQTLTNHQRSIQASRRPAVQWDRS